MRHINKKILLVSSAIGLGLILILFAIQKMNSTGDSVSSADQLSQETDADRLPQETDPKEETVKKEDSLHQEVIRDQNAERSESGQTVTEKTQSETQSEDDGTTYIPEGLELSPEEIDVKNPKDESQNHQQEQDHNDPQQNPGGDDQHSEIGTTQSQDDPQSREVELPAIPIR